MLTCSKRTNHIHTNTLYSYVIMCDAYTFFPLAQLLETRKMRPFGDSHSIIIAALNKWYVHRMFLVHAVIIIKINCVNAAQAMDTFAIESSIYLRPKTQRFPLPVFAMWIDINEPAQYVAFRCHCQPCIRCYSFHITVSELYQNMWLREWHPAVWLEIQTNLKNVTQHDSALSWNRTEAINQLKVGEDGEKRYEILRENNFTGRLPCPPL